jgi:hypothetical protein
MDCGRQWEQQMHSHYIRNKRDHLSWTAGSWPALVIYSNTFRDDNDSKRVILAFFHGNYIDHNVADNTVGFATAQPEARHAIEAVLLVRWMFL